MIMNNEKFILDFIKGHKIAVVSTMDKNTPESAVVEFSETKDLEIIFDTFSYFRKYRNMKRNPNVSIVIGWDNNVTVQYEGVSKEITEDELRKYKTLHVRKLPDAKKYVNSKDIKFFRVAPKWIRYSDLNKKPWEIIEIKF